MESRASWQLPLGVSAGTWDYARAGHVATDYDEFFADHAMFRLDRSVVNQYCPSQGRVVDLGSGTGRALLPLVERGLRGVAVDLSQSMLRVVQEKRRKANLCSDALECVRANLADLSCFADQSFDCALCLFSTLGMIRGAHPRMQTIRHVARILRAHGIFVMQVHNYWAQLFDAGGPWWMVRNAARAWIRRDIEIGDKFYAYRGIPNMYLHAFSRRSLRKLLRGAGFSLVAWIPLNRAQQKPLPSRWFCEGLRASGWIVVARKEMPVTADVEEVANPSW